MTAWHCSMMTCGIVACGAVASTLAMQQVLEFLELAGDIWRARRHNADIKSHSCINPR